MRILQEQGFAVQAALVHFAGMADDAVETEKQKRKRLIKEQERQEKKNKKK